MLRKAFWIVLYVALLPLFVAIALLAMPLVVLSRAWDFWRLRWYCWRSRCWMYVVCSPRRGWHEFIANNLAPILPADVRLVWTNDRQAQGALVAMFGSGLGQTKPYLAQVSWLGVRVRSLHNQLQRFKSAARIEKPVQDALRAVIAREVRGGDGQA